MLKPTKIISTKIFVHVLITSVRWKRHLSENHINTYVGCDENNKVSLRSCLISSL